MILIVINIFQVKTPLVWLDELDQKAKVVGFEKITTKGPWGRPLTKYAKCGINKTIYLDCEKRLQCYQCTSTNDTGCFNQTNMQVQKISEGYMQCSVHTPIQCIMDVELSSFYRKTAKKVDINIMILKMLSYASDASRRLKLALGCNIFFLNVIK